MYGKGNSVGKRGCDGGDQPGIIHLSHGVSIDNKCVGRRLQDRREICPANAAGHIKQESRHYVIPRCIQSGQARQIAENDGKYHRGQQRLDDSPQRPQDRLLILRNEVSLYKQEKQIAITINDV